MHAAKEMQHIPQDIDVQLKFWTPEQKPHLGGLARGGMLLGILLGQLLQLLAGSLQSSLGRLYCKLLPGLQRLHLQHEMEDIV